MKKYIIKNADGSEQTVMQAVHASYNEAVKTLMDYLNANNDSLSLKDPDYLTPFDFTIEEVEYYRGYETIIDLESAREALSLKPNNFTLSGCLDKFDEIVKLIRDVNPKYVEALIALNKLFTIAQAWNEADEFEPDFSDKEQDKWFPLFRYSKDATVLVFAYSGNAWSCMLTDEYVAIVGSPLCFKSSERAAQFGKQFVDLYNKIFL